MNFTKEQKRQAYQKLPPEIQSFIMDSDTTNTVEQLLSGAGIVGEKNDAADSEVLYGMYGLQNIDTTIQNISRLSGKSLDQLSDLRLKLQDFIFDEISEIMSSTSIETRADATQIKPSRQNNVGNDFEKMIMNQVKGMMPAVEAPNNLPTAQDNTGESNKEPKPTESARKIHSYGVKEDPYREPVE